jgi:glycosyltransferase involved in cell wall biosynthesis
MTLSGKRLLIVEECLKDLNGHFFEWNRSVREMNVRAGAVVEIYAHRNIEPELQRMLQARAHFTNTYIEKTRPSHGALDAVISLCRFIKTVYQSSHRALQEAGPVDCVLISTTRIHQLAAWYILCRKYLTKRFQRVVCYFVIGQAHYFGNSERPHFPKRALLLSFLLKLYRKWVRHGQVVFCVDCDRLAAEYEALSGVRFAEIPIPTVSVRALPPRQEKRAATTFLSLGAPREEKGSDILIDAIRLFRQKYGTDNVRFVIQWPTNFRKRNGEWITVAADVRDDPTVIMIDRFLSSSEMDEYLADADCVLLPYRWQNYFSRSSGFVVEAAAAGLPVLVTENTWLERAMNDYGWGIAAKDGDAADIADKIHAIACDVDHHKKQARKRMDSARERHSPERLLNILWGEFPAAESVCRE